MKKKSFLLLIIIFLFITINLFPGENFKIKVSSIEIKKNTKNSYSIKFSVKYKGLHKEYFDDTTVPMPVEELIINGEFLNYKIKERDFLFAGIDLDINGDDDLEDIYNIKYNNKNYYLDGYKLDTSTSVRKYNNSYIYKYFNDKNEPSINKFGEKGIPFIIYNIDYYSKRMVLGVNKGEKPVEIRTFPNPNIQVILMKPVDSINKKIDFSIGGETNYYAHTNEKIIPGNDDLWNGIAWIVKEMKINKNKKNFFQFTLSNITPPFAIYVVPNLTMEKGIRIKMKPRINILNIE